MLFPLRKFDQHYHSRQREGDRRQCVSFCTELTSIRIPEGVTSISDSMFFDCSALTSVTLPDSVTSIGFHVFSYCCNLTSLKIPDSVTSIGSQVFSYCYNLTSLKIPDSVTNMDANPFYGCDQLVLSLSPDHPTLKIVDGVLFSKPDNRLIYYPNIKKESYVVPEGTQTIGAFAFTECDALTQHHPAKQRNEHRMRCVLGLSSAD